MNKDNKLIYEAYTEGEIPSGGTAAYDLVISSIDEQIYNADDFIKHLDQQDEADIEDVEIMRYDDSPHGYTSIPGMDIGLSHFDDDGNLRINIPKGTAVRFEKVDGGPVDYILLRSVKREDDFDRYEDAAITPEAIRKYFDLSSSSRARIALKGLR